MNLLFQLETSRLKTVSFQNTVNNTHAGVVYPHAEPIRVAAKRLVCSVEIVEFSLVNFTTDLSLYATEFPYTPQRRNTWKLPIPKRAMLAFKRLA